jgi:hypothetical protein
MPPPPFRAVSASSSEAPPGSGDGRRCRRLPGGRHRDPLGRGEPDRGGTAEAAHLREAVLGTAGGHQDLTGTEEADAGGHPLDHPAAGLVVGSGGQHHQAGAQPHQHVHPQPVRMGNLAMVGAVDPHREAAEHRQAEAQQILQIGREPERGHAPHD